MEITGKIIAELPQRSGVSARSGSEWRVATYVLETMDQYPRRMCFEVFGADRIQQFAIQVGETMVVSFDIDAREFQRNDGTVTWFNSIRAWKVDRNLQSTGVAPAPGMDAAGIPPFAPAPAAPAAPFAAAPAPAPQAAPAPVAAPQFNNSLNESSTDDLPF